MKIGRIVGTGDVPGFVQPDTNLDCDNRASTSQDVEHSRVLFVQESLSRRLRRVPETVPAKFPSSVHKAPSKPDLLTFLCLLRTNLPLRCSPLGLLPHQSWSFSSLILLLAQFLCSCCRPSDSPVRSTADLHAWFLNHTLIYNSLQRVLFLGK